MTYNILSASSLDSEKVKNNKGEDLGKIKDIMINTHDNKIEYYVLSFGGFLGLGDKLFAIPPQALTISTNDKCFTLNVNKEVLENAEGFDKDNWPNMSDPQFRKNTYAHYGYEYDEVNKENIAA